MHMNSVRKIALFFGHVASNIGDLAINQGQISVLKQAFPEADIHVVLFNARKSDFLHAARESLGKSEGVTVKHFDGIGSRALEYAVNPDRFLEISGSADADLIVLAAGEHLFQYSGGENQKSLFWRILPAFAARSMRKPCLQMPATFGPFEDTAVQNLMRSFFTVTGEVFAREPRSSDLVHRSLGVPRPRVALDPAFFLTGKKFAYRLREPNRCRRVGIVLRSEGWGIRLPAQLRDELTTQFAADGYASSRAFQFALALGRRILAQSEARIVLLIQTEADRELVEHVATALASLAETDRVEVVAPVSVDDYLEHFSILDSLVAARFHAVILGLLAGVPGVGVYFDQHGHKMPGLFDMLDMSQRCIDLSAQPFEAAAELAFLRSNESIDSEGVMAVLEELRGEAVRTVVDAACVPRGNSMELTIMRPLIEAARALAETSDAATHARAMKEAAAKSQSLGAQLAAARSALADRHEALAQLNTGHAAMATDLHAMRDEISRLGSAAADGRAATDHIREEISILRADVQATREALDVAQTESRRRQNEFVKKAARKAVRAHRRKEEAAPTERRRKRAASSLRGTLSMASALSWIRGGQDETLNNAATPKPRLDEDGFLRVHERFAEGGFAAVETLLREGGYRAKTAGRAYLRLSKTLYRKDAESCLEAARRAFFTDPDNLKRKWLSFRTFDAGKPRKAWALLKEVPESELKSLWEKRKAREIRDGARKVRRALRDEPAAAKPSRADPLELFRQGGVAAVIAEIAAPGGGATARRAEVRGLIEAAGALRDAGHLEAELVLTSEAARRKPDGGALRALLQSAKRQNDLVAAGDALSTIEASIGAAPTDEQHEILLRMKRLPAYAASIVSEIPERRPARRHPVPGKVAYLLHNSLPYSSGGYATRAHGLAHGFVGNGWNVVGITRPGYPFNVKPELEPDDVPPMQEHDGIVYRRLPMARRENASLRDSVLDAAGIIEEFVADLQPEFVMAASNYQTGLPALIAARRLGIPFIYEVRGFWEVTRRSREPEFTATAAYALHVLLETAVANGAEHVFTLTKAMGAEMVDRGVTKPITLLPNSCDPVRFRPRGRDDGLADQLGIGPGVPVIGYVGTFVQYEGLEHLAEACARLVERGTEFRLLLVGNENASGSGEGPITTEIRRIAAESALGDRLILTGRVPYEDVERYYSLIDIAAFPRKPQPVTEMVSPMKPLEAMAMEKAVVVSNVRALAEMVQDGETGLIFEKGDLDSLAGALGRLIDDEGLRRRMGKASRAWIKRERNWAATARRAIAEIERHRVTDPLLVREAG